MVAPFGEIGGVPVEFTRHALQRMLEMEITPDQIRKLILEPEDVYDSIKYPDSTYHRRGDHSVAFRLDETKGRYVICTVLFSTKAAWLKADRDGMLGPDRPLRLDQNIPHC